MIAVHWKWRCNALVLAVLACLAAASVEAANLWEAQIQPPAAPRPISPLIYGLAAAPADVLGAWRIPVNRWGGNTADRYNWELGNAWNTGNDWFFMNVAIESDAWRGFLERARNSGAVANLTVPLVGYVAKDTTSASYSIVKYGRQAARAPGAADAGDGRLPDGRPFFGNDPHDANRRADPAFVAQWVREIRRDFPDLVAERRLIVTLGNEPMLWNITHRDVHPEPVNYQAYLDRYMRMARMLRRELPEARLAGPELWGWPAYFESARDRDEKRGLDRRANRNMPFLPWFLQRLHEHEQKTGECLLDIVTVHYYPQAEMVFSDADTIDVRQRRIASTRSLWDAGYRDPSWINERVRLIPRLREWVDTWYPGRGVGITEYNWGGQQDISGAIALADVLGIFGREGLELACYWTFPPKGSFAARAFALYRNVDGRGAAFGADSWDVRWIRRGKADPHAAVAVHAAEDPDTGAMTLILINKLQEVAQLRLSIPAGLVEQGAPVVYALGPEQPAIEVASHAARLAWQGQTLCLTLPEHTIYHVRLKRAAGQ